VEHENILDEYLDYFRTRYESPEEIIEKTVEYVEKRLGITKSGLDA
jgi:ribosomal protein S17E